VRLCLLGDAASFDRFEDALSGLRLRARRFSLLRDLSRCLRFPLSRLSSSSSWPSQVSQSRWIFFRSAVRPSQRSQPSSLSTLLRFCLRPDLRKRSASTASSARRLRSLRSCSSRSRFASCAAIACERRTDLLCSSVLLIIDVKNLLFGRGALLSDLWQGYERHKAERAILTSYSIYMLGYPAGHIAPPSSLLLEG